MSWPADDDREAAGNQQEHHAQLTGRVAGPVPAAVDEAAGDAARGHTASTVPAEAGCPSWMTRAMAATSMNPIAAIWAAAMASQGASSAVCLLPWRAGAAGGGLRAARPAASVMKAEPARTRPPAS